MNFYYDPILGLQYTNLHPTIILDIAVIPKDLDIKQFLKEWQESYNLFWDTEINYYPQIEVIGNITEYRL